MATQVLSSDVNMSISNCQVSSQKNNNFSGNSSATVLNHLLKGGNSLEIAFVVGLIPNAKETVFLIKKSCSANPLSSFRPSVDYIVPGEMELTSAVRCVLVDRPTQLICIQHTSTYNEKRHSRLPCCVPPSLSNPKKCVFKCLIE